VGDADRISNIESGKELFRAATPAVIPPQSLPQCVPYRLKISLFALPTLFWGFLGPAAR
jgi:hypothetical protein